MKYGWVPDNPQDDHRDYKLAHPGLVPVPEHVDLRPLFPPMVDQGPLGSCVGNSLAGDLLFAGMRQDHAPVELSRLFIYYNARLLEDAVEMDAGCQIRDAVKGVARYGACLELAWPYDIEKYADKPDDIAYFDAKQRKAIRYLSLPQDENALQAVLASGYPIIFGFMVYPSFESDWTSRSGEVRMPGGRESEVGGHCISLVGYDMPEQVFMFRNSYGTGWGASGYGTMPFAYVLDGRLSSDFWVIKGVA